MSNGATFEDLLSFLDYTVDKGLMKRATVVSRKAAANKVFQELDEDDRADVLAVDLDDAMNRFINKAGNNYTPDSLLTYKSRLKSAIDDFQAYRANPMGFRPSAATRNRKPKSVATEASGPETAPASSSPTQRATPPTTVSTTEILPIPLRADLIVRVQGLPFDLTAAEANKICAVIRAFAPEG